MQRTIPIVICLLALSLVWAQQPLAITNAGLETDANGDGIPDGWGRYISNGTAQTSVDAQVKHGGEGALWVDCAADSRCTISQPVPVTAAGQYTFGCFVKTDLVAGGGAYVYIQWRKGKGEAVSNEKPSPILTGKQDWTEVSCVGTKPADAEGALLVIVVQTAQGKPGTAWADDAWFKAGAFPKGPTPPPAPAAPAAPTATAPTAGPGQIANGSFETDADKDGQPDGWSKAIHGEGFELSRDATVAHTGQASMKMLGQPGAADRSAILQTSAPVATPKAVRVHVWYKGAGRADGILRYRPIPGVVVEMDTYGQRDFHIETPKDEWTEFTFDAPATEEALKAPQVRLEVILYQKGEGALWYDDVSLELLDKYTPKQTQADEVLQMPWRPAAGRVVLQNPPDFSWPPQPGAKSYEFALSRDPQFPAGQTATARTPYNVYSHSATLAVGTWHWRMRYLDAAGAASEWSDTRPFVVTAAATPFPVPSPEDLLARIPQGHPRVYATAASLTAFRVPMQGAKKQWWENFQARLGNWLQKDTEKEPPSDWLMGARTSGKPLTDEDIQAGNKLRGYAGSVNTRLQDLAFGYLLSGDRKYADKAIAQMMEMATWDPLGVTSYKNQDQVFRDIAWMTATAYDWCYDVMTPEQHQTIRESVLVRARTLYKDFTGARSLTEYPYDSHGITAYGYLGTIAIALAHETEEADGWFKFVAATYPAVFPPWGGEEGGWSQGVGYWKWSQHFAWVFFDALKSATGLNMYDKAYCRNNGWYKLTMHPPWCDRHHFGDGNHGPPDSTDQSNLARYATEYRNPYFQWYARSLPYRLDFGLYSYWWHDDTVPAKPPADLPQGRYFPDIGWVAMHSDLSDPNDVMLMFKSSRYGSYNHSHADQNSFVLYAYGEPLLIDSGYYDWYGSDHDVGYTRQTKAHNDILVNGEGQPIFDMSAQGQILRHFSSPAVDYALGDATVAYKGKLTKFQRHILYLRPSGFLVIDDLEAPKESTFTWCLHAEQEMKLRPEQQEVVVTRGNARCLVKFITPQGLKLEQTDQFTPPSVRKLANEWHTTATTTTKTKQMRFITFIRPAPLSEPEADLEVKAQFANDLLLLVWGTTPQPGGVMTAYLGEGGFNASVIGPWTTGAVASVIDGRALNLKDAQGEFQLLGADKAITATLELRGKDNATAQVANVFVQANENTPIELRVRDAVKTVTLDGKPLAASQYRWAAEKLKLTLPAGEHVLRINPEPETAQAPPVNVTLAGKPLQQKLEAMHKWTGGLLTWGSFAGPGLPVRLAQLQAPEGARVLINNQPPQPGEMAWLGTDNTLDVRSDTADPIRVAYEQLVTNSEPVAMATPADDAEKLPGAIKWEAEDYAQAGGGNLSRYTNRPFLSGGMGLGNWTGPGQWVQWQIKVAQDGRYRLYCKAATHEAQATRLITLDNKPVGTEYRVFRFANTRGFGATPEEWRVFQLPEALDLKAGTHTLKMMCLNGLLNLDWLAVAP